MLTTDAALSSGSTLFQSFFMGGFECATQRLGNGKRLDMLAATQHDRFAAQDFARLQQVGMTTIRTGVRWHLHETRPYHYDFSALRSYAATASAYGIQPIWDLCHFGYPNDLDIFSDEFVQRLAHFSAAAARVIIEEMGGQTPFFCPVNEMSFWSWGGADVGYLNPFVHGRGFDLKRNLARATIAAIDSILAIAPNARFISVDPVIHILARPDHPQEREVAEGWRQAQFQAWDMLAGRLCPELGGGSRYLDIIGLNYYQNNQWMFNGPVLAQHDPHIRPFHQIAAEVHARYGRPMFISETGIEGDERPYWLRYMMNEVMLLSSAYGIQMEGLCIYPILSYPGWDDERHCPTGLWDYADSSGNRPTYTPLAIELLEQQRRLALVAGELMV